MDKRKNGKIGSGWENWLGKRVFLAILAITACAMTFAILKTGGICFALESADSLRYGIDGSRNQRAEADAVRDAFRDMALTAVDGSGIVITHRPIDIAFYDGFDLVGTIWVLRSDPLDTWYVQINDGGRNDCGMYAVPWEDVKALVEGLTDD